MLIWKGKNPRIPLPILQLPKDRGGLAVPQIRLIFFLAAQLQHFVGWGAMNTRDPNLAILLPGLLSIICWLSWRQAGFGPFCAAQL